MYFGSTLGLILHCFVKHYASQFLISEQEALCLILEPYYICFLVLLWYFKVLWCHLAIDHLFQSVALSGELCLRSQSETFKCSDLISNFWTRQIKKPWLKGVFFTSPSKHFNFFRWTLLIWINYKYCNIYFQQYKLLVFVLLLLLLLLLCCCCCCCYIGKSFPYLYIQCWRFIKYSFDISPL